ncbi:MAG: hypothetical protein A4E53_00326 [Pelotomaculum sp. PtaB.Bin104]|nr:MAG: hypothetical protein A4E53_00326 [Pelotomaculum sp. PtaB.Bin104]
MMKPISKLIKKVKIEVASEEQYKPKPMITGEDRRKNMFTILVSALKEHP